MNIEEILLWLFVLVLGTAFGAGFYEMRVVLPLWFASPPESIRSPILSLLFCGWNVPPLLRRRSGRHLRSGVA